MLFARMLSAAHFLLLTAAVSTLSEPAAYAQEGGTEHSTGIYSDVIFDDCTGEFVALFVDYRYAQHIFSDRNGGDHVQLHFDTLGIGIGLTSGTIYVGNSTNQLSAVVNGVFVESSPYHFSLISRGGSDNLEVLGNLHFTLNPNGFFTADFERLTTLCRGNSDP